MAMSKIGRTAGRSRRLASKFSRRPSWAGITHVFSEQTWPTPPDRRQDAPVLDAPAITRAGSAVALPDTLATLAVAGPREIENKLTSVPHRRS